MEKDEKGIIENKEKNTERTMNKIQIHFEEIARKIIRGKVGDYKEGEDKKLKYEMLNIKQYNNCNKEIKGSFFKHSKLVNNLIKEKEIKKVEGEFRKMNIGKMIIFANENLPLLLTLLKNNPDLLNEIQKTKHIFFKNLNEQSPEIFNAIKKEFPDFFLRLENSNSNANKAINPNKSNTFNKSKSILTENKIMQSREIHTDNNNNNPLYRNHLINSSISPFPHSNFSFRYFNILDSKNYPLSPYADYNSYTNQKNRFNFQSTSHLHYNYAIPISNNYTIKPNTSHRLTYQY